MSLWLVNQPRVPRSPHRSSSRRRALTSLGLYRVGHEITSRKHGADYVSERFIAQTGRLGRSWGFPAVPLNVVAQIIATVADGGLLLPHASGSARAAVRSNLRNW